MSYDEHLADRIRSVLEVRDDVSERKMFGGIAFMIGDNMAVGIVGSDLMVRVGPEAWEKALSLPHARPMDFTGRPMTGFVYVAPKGMATDTSLRQWIDRGLAFVATLPAKKKTSPRPRKPSSGAPKPRKRAPS